MSPDFQEVQARPDADVIEDLETSLQVLIPAGAADGVPPSPDPSEIERAVKALTGERQEITRGLFDRAAAIGGLTRWQQPILLDRIGCKHRTKADLEDLGTDRLQNCARFLGLLSHAADSVSTVAKRREVVVTLARLIRQTDQTGKGLAELLELGDPSPWEYVQLGEINQAARVARINAGSARPEDREVTPVSAGPAAHISIPRLDAYLRGEREAFGEQTFARVGEHIDGCPECSEVARSRRTCLAV